jgi:hypothetical protein
MKTIPTNLIRSLILAGSLTLTGIASAQTASSTTTTQTSTSTAATTSAGTITEFSPDVITVRTESATAPVAYSYSKTTTYVDQSGNPVSMEVVKSGVPVTVYYTQDGDKMVATKVVVQKTTDAAGTTVEKKTTTTTTNGQ